MSTELEHPGYADHREEHAEKPFTKAEDEQLNFLLLRMENCRNNMADHHGKPEFGMLVLESQIAEMAYKLRWCEISHERVRSSYLLEMEANAELHQRMSTLERFFCKELVDTVKKAVEAQRKQDDFDRLIGVYKNGLKRGAAREREAAAAGKK